MTSAPPSCFGVGSLGRFAGLDQVGEGTYGYVYKARDQSTGETVALKRLIFHKEITGFPLNAVRELKFLKCLQHKNIVQLKDVVSSKGYEQIEKDIKTDTNRGEEKRSDQEKGSNGNNKTVLSLCGNLYLVFEFVEHDLGGLLDSKYKFNVREVKCIAKQLFEVLEFLSEKKVLHRDIKSSNILITNRHQIKLADFGLARSIQSADGRELRVDLTNNVVTMWYKPPELILGAVRYAHSVDVWSVGCVLAELELGRPLFPGRTDAEQIDLICRTLGTPSEEIWGGLRNMPCYDSLLLNATTYNSSLRSSCSGKLTDSIVDLLERILVFDPVRRPSAKILLTNKYFNTQPLAPIDPTDLEPLHITPGMSYHEYRTKQQKRQRGADCKEDEALPAFSPVKSSAPSATVLSASGSLSHLQMHTSAPPPPPSNMPPSYLPSGAAGIGGAPIAPGGTFPKPPPPAAPKRPRFGDDAPVIPPFAPAFAANAAAGMGLGGTGGLESYGASILPAPVPAMMRGVPGPPSAAAPPLPPPASAPVVPKVPVVPAPSYGGYGGYGQAQQQAGAAYGASIVPNPAAPRPAHVPQGMSQPAPPVPQHNAYNSNSKPYGGNGSMYSGNEGYRQGSAPSSGYRDGTYRDAYGMRSEGAVASAYDAQGPGMYAGGGGGGGGGYYYDSAGPRGAPAMPMYGAPIAPMQPSMNMPAQGGYMQGNMQGNMQGTMQAGGMYGRPYPDGGSNRYGPGGNSAYPGYPQQDQQRGGYNDNTYGGRQYRK